MAHISYPFKKTNKNVFRKPFTINTSDTKYWNKLGLPVLVKEFGAVDYLDFSPVEPYYFAATCSVRVQIYDPITKLVTKNISKFVEAAYGGVFRRDGRLLVAGSEEAMVKLFDVQSKNVLRVFTGHTAPVHRTFFTKDQNKVISYSDDKTVCLWDIATEEKITCFTGHTDYVRAGAASPLSPEIILSAGYDHQVKLYDCRSNETVVSVDHKAPVESALFLPTGGIFISAGGTEIKVWDLFNGGKLLANISQHHKTVTCLRLAQNGSRLMSGSLDRHLKIYDVATFQVVHNIDFPNAILSMGISEQDDALAVGMVDGIISVRKRERPAKKTDENKASFRFAPDHVQTENTTVVVDEVVTHRSNKNHKVPHHDMFLRKMEFGKALGVTLRSHVSMKTPEVTTALIHELLRRNVLHIALYDLTEGQIGVMLKYLKRNVGETRFTRVVIDAANVFIDVFENQLRYFSEQNRLLFNALRKEIREEIEVCKQVAELEGAIMMLLAGAHTDNAETQDIQELALTPSVKARKELVIDV